MSYVFASGNVLLLIFFNCLKIILSLCAVCCAKAHAVTLGMPDSTTIWTLAHQAPLSMGFSRQEYWSGLPCPPPGDLPDPEIEPLCLLHWQAGSLTLAPPGNKIGGLQLGPRAAKIGFQGLWTRCIWQILAQILALLGINHITLGTLPGINHVIHVTFLKFSSP